MPGLPERGHHGQDARNGSYAAVERQLAEQCPRPTGGPDLLVGQEDADRDRDVVGGPALATVSRCEVHGDARERVGEAGVPDRAADSLSSLRQCRIGQPHDRERGQAVGDVDLDPHELAAQAMDDCRVEDREHALEDGRRCLPGDLVRLRRD